MLWDARGLLCAAESYVTGIAVSAPSSPKTAGFATEQFAGEAPARLVRGGPLFAGPVCRRPQQREARRAIAAYRGHTGLRAIPIYRDRPLPPRQAPTTARPCARTR